MGMAPVAPLQCADGVATQPGVFSQLLLRESGFLPQLSEEFPEL
jgi:hypothetical protein